MLEDLTNVIGLCMVLFVGLGWVLFWLTTPPRAARARMRCCQRCGLIMSCILVLPSCPHGNRPCPLTRPEERP
jgi:hypothetical protein